MVPLLGALRAVMAHGIEVKNSQAGAGGWVYEPPPDSDLSKAFIGGLKLEPRKLPMKMIVVDHVDMTPTAN
jgi:uncharacterized protein (TIGR03435 family)